MGINNIVFVGGNTRHHRYPGPSVSEANVVAHALSERGVIGDVTIRNIPIYRRGGMKQRGCYSRHSQVQNSSLPKFYLTVL